VSNPQEAPDHLAPFEPAARIYCEHTGADPDGTTPLPHPLIQGASIHVLNWRLAAERLLDLSTMLTAMKQAAAASKIVVQ
jgi:hypothetical protein